MFSIRYLCQTHIQNRGFFHAVYRLFWRCERERGGGAMIQSELNLVRELKRKNAGALVRKEG